MALAVAVKSELAVTASAILLEKNRQKVNGANQADLAQNFERYTRPRILPGTRNHTPENSPARPRRFVAKQLTIFSPRLSFKLPPYTEFEF